MIKLIGLKRTMIVAAAYFLVLTPMVQQAQSRLATLNSDIADLNGKITTAKQETVFLAENMVNYRVLQYKGFFM